MPKLPRHGREVPRSAAGRGPPVGFAVTVSFFASAGLMIGGSGVEALFFARYGFRSLL